MKGLNPKSVRINNNTIDSNCNEQNVPQTVTVELENKKPKNKKKIDYEKYAILNDSSDTVNSKSIIDNFNLAGMKSYDKDVIAGCIILEVKRLLIRSAKACSNSRNIAMNILDEKIVKNPISIIEYCIRSVVVNRSDKDNYYKSTMIYNIAFILDVFNIDQSTNETAKLAAFINYFIDVFTS